MASKIEPSNARLQVSLVTGSPRIHDVVSRKIYSCMGLTLIV